MEQLEALVDEFAARRERGEQLSAERFCALHPEGGARLAHALAALEQAEQLLGTPSTPAAIGEWRVVAELGRGGMGRVFEVERAGERRALKWLHEGVALDARAQQRLRREAEALAALEHPSIARLHAAGVHEGRPYLVMELVRGVSLAEHVARHVRARGRGACVELPGSGAPLERVLALVEALARALAVAHAAGVLHRDATPRNVIVRADGAPVLIDFGLARASDSATLTRTGDLLGTPAYMAPEQARGERVDALCDVYGLGAILRELLTSRPPRAGGASALATIQTAARRPLGALAGVAEPSTRAARTVARRATAFDARRRYASAAELADDLARCRARAPIAAREPGLVERAHELWLTRRGTMLIAAALVCAAALITAWRARPPDEAQRAARARDAHDRAACAWLDGDAAALRSAAEELLRAAPEDAYAHVLAELAAGRLPERASDASAQAWLDAEHLRRDERRADAVAKLRSANDVRPGVALVAAALGTSAFAAGETELAQGVLERHARELASSHVFHETLSRVYFERGLAQDACQAARAAIALAPDAATPRVLLARALVACAEREAATSALAAARERGGDANELERLAREIDALAPR